MRKRFWAIIVGIVMTMLLPSMVFAAENGTVDVENADQLIAVMTEMTENPVKYADLTININADIDLAGKTWVSGYVNGYNGAGTYTVNGNGNTIFNLSAPLFSGTWAGNSGLVIKDLTIADSTIVSDENDSTGTTGVGAFVGYPSSSGAGITLSNCHLLDSTVKGGHWTGGLIGTSQGYSGTDGPVFVEVTIDGCSVKGSVITGNGSVGGIIGHGALDAWTKINITNTTVSGNTITSNSDSPMKAGSVLGTIGAAGSEKTVNGETKTGGIYVDADVSDNKVTSNGTTIDRIYGRMGSDGGALTVTGGNYPDWLREDQSSDANIGTIALPEDGAAVFKELTDYITINDGTKKYRTLSEAFAATDKSAAEVIYHVYGKHDVENTAFSAVENKSAKFVGETEDAALDLGAKAHPAHGSKLIFEKLTLIKDNVDYAGFHHAAKESYVDCILEGQYWVYATESSFTNCTFQQTSPDAYNIWCYGSQVVTFEDCTFNEAGKSILVYNEGAVGSAVVTIKGCTFNANEDYVEKDKAAVEIDSSLLQNGGYTVNIEDCELDCKIISGMWRDKKPTGNLTVNDKDGAAYVIKHSGDIEVTKEEKDATCTAEGFSGNIVCGECKAVLDEGTVIPKTAHTYKDGKCTVCSAADPDYKPEATPIPDATITPIPDVTITPVPDAPVTPAPDTTPAPAPTTSTTVKTGDSANLMMLFSTIVLAGMTVVVIGKKRFTK